MLHFFKNWDKYGCIYVQHYAFKEKHLKNKPKNYYKGSPLEEGKE